ncbi:DJ-1/PfpI family protein [Peptoniphilus sp. KCTC 25270]|uniref:DJ-1 family glyoxalase III n=1 Tax=Peptoniphilus sp. KCTC 25270 TaxID=2897414 RepID=UPI001E459334|nr:DJ-1 family glyoxalase III [Peptoniphilus sp. KCTC 25270]MCD1147932.1 DJ-1/PfpI family protein [Peptoniphilus sp. KCTC 25270]
MKRLAVFFAEGFEDIEALTVVDFCRRAGIEVDTISIREEKEVVSAHNVTIVVDKTIGEVQSSDYDGMYLPGGLPGATNLAESPEVLDILREAKEKDLYIGAICAAPLVLDTLGYLEDGKFICYPGFEENLKAKPDGTRTSIENGKILTGMGPAFAMEFAFLWIEKLMGEEKAEEIKEETLYSILMEKKEK